MRIGKSSTVIWAFLLAAGLWVSSARADIIHLKNGSQIVGKIVREEGDDVVIKVSFGELRIAKEDIERVEEEPTPSPTPTPSPSAAPDVGDSPEATEMVSPSPSPEATAPPAEDFTVKPFDESCRDGGAIGLPSSFPKCRPWRLNHAQDRTCAPQSRQEAPPSAQRNDHSQLRHGPVIFFTVAE